MHPVILSIGNFSLSSFGLLLSLGFFGSVFAIWRLARVYEVDQEKIIDLCLLTFFASLIGARAWYVLLNLDQYNTLSKIVLLNRYPGLSFWGGFLPGVAVLYLLSKRFKLPFWEIADFAMVGLFIGLILGSFGCLLSSCQYGIISNGPFSVSQSGLIGNRFPVQILVSLAFLWGYFYLWKSCLRFHFPGKIAALGLILLGVIKFITAFLRADSFVIYKFFTLEHLLSLVAIISGTWLYYHQSKRRFTRDLIALKLLFISPKERRLLLLNLKKSWYNLKVNLKFNFKRYLSSINVKHKPPQF